MRTLYLPPENALARGRFHGETLRSEIREIAEIRSELACSQGRFRSRAELDAIAERHLPILQRWDRGLYDELIGIAEGSGLSAARIVVLNHYTDLKDIDPRTLGPSNAERDDECTVLVASTHEGAFLGQTWDMHGSALPYVVMMHLPSTSEGTEAWLFTIAGCLGMAGMNAYGVAITINNLKSLDARIGLAWPALVRRVLREDIAETARDTVLRAPLGSGHHYLVADAYRAYGIETSGTLSDVWTEVDLTRPGNAAHHENHCVSPRIKAVSSVSETSTTLERHRWMESSLGHRPIANGEDLWERLGSHDGFPRSVCTHLSSLEEPHAMRTCGAVSMSLTERRVWAADGCIRGVIPDEFRFENAPREDAPTRRTRPPRERG